MLVWLFVVVVIVVVSCSLVLVFSVLCLWVFLVLRSSRFRQLSEFQASTSKVLGVLVSKMRPSLPKRTSTKTLKTGPHRALQTTQSLVRMLES